MKKNEKKELHTKTADELKKLIKEAQVTLGSLMLDKEQYTLKNTRSVFNKRKEVAVLKTILKEKEEAK
jgi:ribosomal protein L29